MTENFRLQIADCKLEDRSQSTASFSSNLQSAICNLKFPLVFLVGYRGTGKSTVGRLLARRLGWGWVDADEALEERHGRTIRQIFAEEDEAGFREKEAALLEELCRGERVVVATGGGVVLREENRRRLRAAGRVVWLTADAPTIWERLQRDPTTSERRPALTVGGLAEVEELLRAREPLYRACADFVVDTRGRAPDDIVAALVRAATADVREPRDGPLPVP
jgi:shikimate kinase